MRIRRSRPFDSSQGKIATPEEGDAPRSNVLQSRLTGVKVTILRNDSLQLANVGDRISSYGDEISKFPGLNSATRFRQPNNSAAFVVTARMMSSGGMPASCKAANMVAVA